MKKLILTTALAFGMLANAESAELLERMPLPEGRLTMQSAPSPNGYRTSFLIYNDYSAKLFDEDLKCIAVLENVVPNQGLVEGVQGKIDIIEYGERGFEKFIYFATSKPGDPSPWWGIKNELGVILYKEEGRSANATYLGYYYTFPNGDKVVYVNADGRMYKVNGEIGSVDLTTVADATNDGYPNPVQRGEAFNIDISGINRTGDITLTVYGLIGGAVAQEVYNDIDNDIIAVDTSQYNEGVYIYNITQGSKNLKSGRIIIK